MNMDYEALIRASNTIFSTLVCPKCGARLEYSSYNNVLTGICSRTAGEKYCTGSINLTVSEIALLLNQNGINSLIQPLETDNISSINSKV